MGRKTTNGRRYYHKSGPQGGRAKATVFGAGKSRESLSTLELKCRAEMAAERNQRKAETAEFYAEELAVSGWFDEIQAAADAMIIAAGYHNHRGQWRRRRR